MSSLLKGIENCKGIDGCFGKVSGSINPIAFSVKRKPVIVMVVTEQPAEGRWAKDDLKSALLSGRKNRLTQRLRDLLGEEFVTSIQKEDGIFYWTHFIKCPGNFRDHRKGLTVTACADTHLFNEIITFKPKLLISVGGRCGEWLLNLAAIKADWRDCVLDEVCKGRIRELDIGVLKVRTIFLIHPAERSGLGWYIDGKLKNLIQNELTTLLQEESG
jgi:uracil-DNA glycosylase